MMSDPESLTPYTPTPLPSRRPSARGFGRRSRAFGLRPVTCDLNLAGARTPCSAGSGPPCPRAGAGRLPKGPRRLDRSIHHAGTGLSKAGFAASGPEPPNVCRATRRLAGLATCRARLSDCGTPAPASRRGPCREAGASFPRWAHHSRSGRGAHAPSLYIMNCDTYLPPPDMVSDSSWSSRLRRRRQRRWPGSPRERLRSPAPRAAPLRGPRGGRRERNTSLRFEMHTACRGPLKYRRSGQSVGHSTFRRADAETHAQSADARQDRGLQSDWTPPPSVEVWRGHPRGATGCGHVIRLEAWNLLASAVGMNVCSCFHDRRSSKRR
jgi:hypothetical protein